MKLLPILAIGALVAAGSASADDLGTALTLIVGDPITQSTLYAGNDSATATYKSTDWGVTWSFMYPVPLVGDIAIDPLNPSILYASGDGATPGANLIFKSTDGGATWNESDSGITGADRAGPLAVDPLHEGVVYAAIYAGGLYKSIDGGQTWTSIDDDILANLTSEIFSPVQLIADPVHPGTLYFSFVASLPHGSHGPLPVAPGLYKTTDGGATWKATGIGGMVALDPANASHMVACYGAKLMSSLDGGATWSSGASCSGSIIAISGINPDRILLADTSSTTVQASDDGGATFSTLHDFQSQIRGIVYRAGNIYVATTGTSGTALFISRNDGATWTAYSAATVPQTIHVPADQSTIQSAIDAASDGDTVLVAPGTYYEQLDFKGKAITLKSSGGAAVTILDGNNGGPIVSFHSGETDAAALQGFTLTHAELTTGVGAAINLSNNSSPTIEDNVFTDNVEGAVGASAIYGDSTSAVILRNYFTGNSGTGTASTIFCVVSFGGSPVVADNVFANNSAYAYCGHIGFAYSPQIYNNTIVGNQVGLLVTATGFGPGTLFKNNLMAFNQVGAEIELSGVTLSGRFANNLVFGNTTDDYQLVADQTGTNGNISSDPLFMDWAAGDVRLQHGSPAIDAGDSDFSQVSSTDVYGDVRVYAGMLGGAARVDIGAAEWVDTGAIAADGSVTTRPDMPVSGTLTAMAAYPGQVPVFSAVSQPAHGTLTLNPSTGKFRYTPVTGFAGTDQFTFQATDSFGTTSDVATESVTVADVAAMAIPAFISTPSRTPYRGSLTARPVYNGQVLTFSVVRQPAHGVVSITDPATGAFTYTATRGYRGRDRFTFLAIDQWGKASNLATVTVTVR